MVNLRKLLYSKKSQFKQFPYNLRTAVYVPAAERFLPGRTQTQLRQSSLRGNSHKNQSCPLVTSGKQCPAAGSCLLARPPSRAALLQPLHATHCTGLALASSGVHRRAAVPVPTAARAPRAAAAALLLPRDVQIHFAARWSSRPYAKHLTHPTASGIKVGFTAQSLSEKTTNLHNPTSNNFQAQPDLPKTSPALQGERAGPLTLERPASNLSLATPHPSLSTMRWKASTASQSSSKQTRHVLPPAQMSPCGPDHTGVESGELGGDTVDWGLRLMPSTTKTLLWRVHSPQWPVSWALLMTLQSSMDLECMSVDPRGTLLSDANGLGRGGVSPQRRKL